MKIPLFLFFIGLAFLFGLISYQRIKFDYIRWFVPFLAITLGSEICSLMTFLKIDGRNHWWYNLYTLFEFIFYIIVFRRAFENKGLKKACTVAIILYSFTFFINVFFIQGWNHFHTYTYRLGSITIITLCFLYFRQIMKSETATNPIDIPLFWISTGLLFFYFGFFIYISAFDFIAYSKIKEYAKLFKFISNFLNIFLYMFITIGIYKSWQIKT